MSVYDIFAVQAKRQPDKVALKIGNHSVTYGALSSLVDTECRAVPHGPFFASRRMDNSLKSVVALLAFSKQRATLLTLAAEMSAEDAMRTTHAAFSNIEEDRIGKAEPDQWPFLLLHTSGTTGDAKIVTLNHDTKVRRVQQFIDLYGITEEDVILVGNPLHQSLAQRLVFVTLAVGATARIVEHYSPGNWLRDAYQCSVVVGVPHQLRHLCTGANSGEWNDWQPKLILSASAPMHGLAGRDGYPYAQEAEERGWNVRECWGTVECAMLTDTALNQHGSVGCAVPGALVSHSAEVGLVAYAPNTFFDGYWGRPDMTARAFTDEGYFVTGDDGHIAPRGSVWLHGRVDDRIKVGGATVRPEEVDEELRWLVDMGITDHAVCGVPDKLLGEVVGLAVVAPFGLNEDDMRSIQSTARVRGLHNAALPRSIITVPEIPKTVSGKILRRKLKEMFP